MEVSVRWLSLFVDRLKSDEKGTALIEYTVLLSILLVGVILVIVAVGGWISGQWVTLNSTI